MKSSSVRSSVADVRRERRVEHLDRLEQPRALVGWLITTTRRESYRTSQRRNHHVEYTAEVVEHLSEIELDQVQLEEVYRECEAHGVELLDIEQIVVRGQLTLAALVSTGHDPIK